jgi:hypothetical protein
MHEPRRDRKSRGEAAAWDWSGFSAFLDLCELQVDGTGAGIAFGPLAFDTTPGYVDTVPALLSSIPPIYSTGPLAGRRRGR